MLKSSLASAALAALVGAQVTWTQLSPATLPPSRSGHAMVYDSVRARIVLFGGSDAANQPLGDTWEFDGSDWIQRTPSGASPSPRRYHAMAYDRIRRVTVLHGGFTHQDVGDLWEWDGTAWFLRTQTPHIVSHHAAIDGDGGVQVFTAGSSFWWNGAAVQNITCTQSPSRLRFSAAKHWGPPATTHYMFGGVDSSFVPRSELMRPEFPIPFNCWQVAGIAIPARFDSAMVYDALRDRLVIFGGSQLPNIKLDATLEFEHARGLSVRQPLQSPPPRSLHAMAFLATVGRTVMFGGLGADGSARADTWTYGPVTAPTRNLFGAGCTGSSGTPTMQLPGDGPWIGYPWGVTISNLAPGLPSLMFFGFSRTSWFGAFNLPIPLAGAGMPGCSLYVSGDVVQVINASSWGFTLNNDPDLIGRWFYHQAFCIDPPANPVGVTASNALEALVGAK